mmetsp:Transcript_123043/g.359172  ORF Transcript_123043/g.359172 Transcript_123043/m.359172 type:complete len:528 (+) Transcript_123043:107-1690(+)
MSRRRALRAAVGALLLLGLSCSLPRVLPDRLGKLPFATPSQTSWSDKTPRQPARNPHGFARSKRLALQAVTGPQDKGVGQASKHVQRMVLLVDGDQFGPDSWKLAAGALGKHGRISSVIIFAPPRESVKKETQAKWVSALQEVGATHYPVPRPKGSSKDPNDIAIGFAAGLLVGRGEVDAIALLASDSDFGFLVRQIISCGCRALWLWPADIPWPPGLDACGAERVPYKMEFAGWNAAKYCIELRPDGSSIIRRPCSKDPCPKDAASQSEITYKCLPLVMPLLVELGYIQHASQSWVPAFAKMCVASGVAFTVYPQPDSCAYHLVQSLARQHWKHNPGNLIYICPRGAHRKTSALSAKDKKLYGSGRCRAMVLGGGAFVLKDGDNVVQRILRRLGFLDDNLNADVGEAIEVFCSISSNRRNLRMMCIDPAVSQLLLEKEKLLRSAFTSSDQPNEGHWGIAPSDKSQRSILLAKGLIRSETCSREEVLACLRDEARKHHRQVRATYNAYVMDWNQHISASTPGRLTSA